MDMDIELRKLCTNLAIDLLRKDRDHYVVDLGTVMDYAKTFYFLSKSLEASDTDVRDKNQKDFFLY
jgi:hypothetical protein